MIIKQFLTKYWYLTAGVVGILSGVAVVIRRPGINGPSDFFIPGAIFGIFSAGYFFSFLLPRPASWKLLLWVIASSMSYYLAVNSVSYGINSGHGGDDFLVFMAAGLIGVGVLIAAFQSLFQRLDWRFAVGLLLAGGIIPMIIPIPFLFIVWQTVVLLIFAYQIHLSTGQNPPQTSLEQQN